MRVSDAARESQKGEAARDYVLAHYEAGQSIDRHLDLYRGLLTAH